MSSPKDDDGDPDYEEEMEDLLAAEVSEDDDNADERPALTRGRGLSQGSLDFWIGDTRLKQAISEYDQKRPRKKPQKKKPPKPKPCDLPPTTQVARNVADKLNTSFEVEKEDELAIDVDKYVEDKDKDLVDAQQVRNPPKNCGVSETTREKKSFKRKDGLKRIYNCHKLKERISVLDRLDKGESATQISRLTGIPRPTITTWKLNAKAIRQQVLDGVSANRLRNRGSIYPKLEKALYKWICVTRARNYKAPISDQFLSETIRL